MAIDLVYMTTDPHLHAITSARIDGHSEQSRLRESAASWSPTFFLCNFKEETAVTGLQFLIA